MAKVLIVDDDFEIVSILTEILKKDGHEIESASEPSEGMQKARSMQPDLIILDYNMPGSSGAHLYESLRRNQASRLTPILFMSGEVGAEHILDEVADPRGSRFLPKPVRLREFRRVLREMLSQEPHG